MRKRQWLTVPLCLVAVVAFAAVAATSAKGSTVTRAISSTLHVAVDNSDVDHSDPALSYSVLGWQIEYETCTTLLGYPDAGGKSVDPAVSPLGAKGMPVIKNNGKTYVFTIRSGMKFSNGDKITAANYKYAFDRDADTNLASPVSAFMGAVVGWNNELNSNGKITSVSGVTAHGMKLTIKLTQPDGTMLPKMALPFFCPLDKAAPFYSGGSWNYKEVTGPWPGSGPYYLYSRNVAQNMVLKRNPHYNGKQTHRAKTIVIDMDVSTATAYDGIDNGTYASDLNGNPEPANNYSLAKKYGINKKRFFVKPTFIVAYLAMNEARSAFQAKHVKLRQAVNDVIDRPQIVKIGGYLSGKPATQALPKLLAGKYWKQAYVYPISAPTPKRFKAAKKLGNDCAGGKKINFWHGTSAPAIQAASLDSYDLSKLGCKVNSVGFAGYDRYVAAGIKGNSMDIMTAGWSDDYPDGFDWFGILFNGRTIAAKNNNNLSYVRNRTINKKTDACNEKTGSARVNCWGQLDQWVTKNLAVWATEADSNFVDFVSGNSGGYVYDAPFASVDLGAFYQK